MALPAANSPIPSHPTCPNCGSRLPVHSGQFGSCPLCRDVDSLANRSTATGTKALTAEDCPIPVIDKRSVANQALLIGVIGLLAIIAVLVYFLA